VTTIKATVSGRRLELDVPADWPDGTEVEIHPVHSSSENGDDQLSEEEIARTLAAMELIEPFGMTAAEIADWEAERQTRKAHDKAIFEEHAEKLRKMWP